MKLQSLQNLSTKRLKALNASGINSVTGLLELFPHRYLDKSNIRQIALLSDSDEPVTVVGEVSDVSVTGYGRKKRLEVFVKDNTGIVKAVYFKGWKYFITQFKEGSLVALFGKTKRYGKSISMAHPEVDTLDSKDDVKKFDTLIPIYPSNQHFSKAYISNKIVSGWITEILDNLSIPEFLPDDVLNRHNFPGRDAAFRMMHQPKNQQQPKQALERFKYEEFFLFELSMAKIKQIQISREGATPLQPGKLTKQFFNSVLPFELTEGQKTALSEIRQDVDREVQMNRLIQGDVGAGKTVVAIGAMLMAVDSGFQAAMMAPTEILAEQHYFTLQKFLEPLGVTFRLLRGKQKNALRRDILSDIEGGGCDIVVGTHAIIQESVKFNRLGLAVIDEQHRFGVKQRNEMLNKGDKPHLLVMSATPIPRSLAMTLYSDLDISVIKDLPGGRKPIKTAVRTDKDREPIYRFVEETVRNGGQVYIVYPLIEESEALDLKDATMGFEKIKRRFPDIPAALLHGRMDQKEKEQVMKAFVEGEIKILVSTTVIEVGVDVANAGVMIVEHAERFGLSQLHQLRGRIGRGIRQSYCILMPGQKLSKAGRFRLKKMVETTDGFEIAEADLKLRGPGDFLGTKQSGLPEFKHADIVEDRLLLEQAKNDAWKIIRTNSDLSGDEYKNLKNVFEPYFKERTELFGVG